MDRSWDGAGCGLAAGAGLLALAPACLGVLVLLVVNRRSRPAASQRRPWQSSPQLRMRRHYSEGTPPRAALGTWHAQVAISLHGEFSPLRSEGPRGRSPPAGTATAPGDDALTPLQHGSIHSWWMFPASNRSLSADVSLPRNSMSRSTTMSSDAQQKVSIEEALLAECAPRVDDSDWDQLSEDTVMRWKAWRGSGDEIVGVDDAAMRRRENLSWRLWWRAQQQQQMSKKTAEQHLALCEYTQPQEPTRGEDEHRHIDVRNRAYDDHPLLRTPPQGHRYVAIPESKLEIVRKLLSEP